MGYFPRADRFLAPLVYLTYPIPKIALLPILMLLAGVGEFSKILMIFLIIVFQVVIAVRDAIRTIPVETYYPLYSLGASVRQIFCEVIFLPPCRNSSRLFVLPWQRLFPSCFYRNVWHAIWHGVLHYGCLAARQLSGYVCRDCRTQFDGAAAVRAD